MKVIFLAFFVGLIVSSSALGLSSRFKQQISIHSLHLEKISSLGSALKGLIQLADSRDLTEVVDIIKEVLDEYTSNLAAQEQALAVLTQQEQNAVQQAQDNINVISDSLASATEQHNADLHAQSQYQANIETNTEAITSTNQAIADERARRAEVANANEQHIKNVNDALLALQEAEALLAQIRDEDLPGSSSFIQIQSKKFAKSLVLVQKRLAKTKLRLSTTDLYINELVQIAQNIEAQGTINEELLDQIFVLVEAFKESLTEEAQKVQADDDQDRERSQNALDNFSNTVATQQAALEENQSQLIAVQAKIAAGEITISDLEANLAAAQENLNTIEANFAEQAQISQGIINRLSKDIEVLQSALVFVQTENANISDSDDLELPQAEIGAPLLSSEDEIEEPQVQPPVVPVPEVVLDESTGVQDEAQSSSESDDQTGELVAPQAAPLEEAPVVRVQSESESESDDLQEAAVQHNEPRSYVAPEESQQSSEAQESAELDA